MPQPQVPGQGMSGPRDVFRAAPWTYAPRYGRLSALRGSGYYGGYVDGGYAPYFYADTVAQRSGSCQPGATWSMRLASLVAGVRRRFLRRNRRRFSGSRTLARTGSAPHRAPADGYETATFDVRILEDQTVNYRRDLARETPRAEAPRVAAMPKTFYVVPGCYAGDKPPAAERLPSGCVARNVRTIPPVVSEPSDLEALENAAGLNPNYRGWGTMRM